MNCIYIKGVKVSVCNIETALGETLKLINNSVPSYICVTDAGNIVNAYRNSDLLKEAINLSAISLPDGRPISLLAGFKGISGIDRVAGFDFMSALFKVSEKNNIRHFFLGDSEETLQKLKILVQSKFNVPVAGVYSPPFGKWNDSINADVIHRVNSSGADIIWVSLGGGRQEIWMMENYRSLSKGVMVGIGAGLRFFTGQIRRAPAFMQRAGLEWLYRLLQQPGKMAGRYASTLPCFALYSIQEIFSDNMKITKQ